MPLDPRVIEAISIEHEEERPRDTCGWCEKPIIGSRFLALFRHPGEARLGGLVVSEMSTAVCMCKHCAERAAILANAEVRELGRKDD